MTDWFETRFREPVGAQQLDPAFVARMRALVVEEWQAGAGTTPPYDTGSDDREGDIIMLETEDRPTHEPRLERRRRPGRWLMAAAAAAAVAVVGTLLVVAAGDDEDPVDTVTPTPTTTTVPNAMGLGDVDAYEPGRYFVDPDADETTPLRVTFDVTSEGWTPWLGAYKFLGNEEALTGFSITTVTNLTTDACTDPDPLTPPVGPTVGDLVTALTQLPPFEVAVAPSDTTIDGYAGKHLVLTTPDLRITPGGDSPLPNGSVDPAFTDCVDGNLQSWIGGNTGGPFWGYAAVPDIREEFWILDVEGTRLVLVKIDSPSSPAQDIAERDAMFDSINIEP